jgi:hypothetical protein
MAGRTVADDIDWLLDEADCADQPGSWLDEVDRVDEPGAPGGDLNLVPPADLEERYPFEGTETLEPFDETAEEDDADGIVSIVSAVLSQHWDRLGRSARIEMATNVADALEWARSHHKPELGPLAAIARASVATCVARFYEKYTAKGLRQERLDEIARDAALASGEAGISRFLLRLDEQLVKLQRLFPRRWSVPEHAPEDVRGDIIVTVLAILREPDGFMMHERTGRAATLHIAQQLVKRKKKRRIFTVVGSPTATINVQSRKPTPEEELLTKERERLCSAAVWKAGAELSRIKRNWLDECLTDVELHGRLRMARVAKRMGRGRPAAAAAKESLREVFKLLGYEELLKR